jgi:hypothetical protein
MTITSLDLPAIVADHKQWLADPATGKRADLSGVDLSGVDLSGANLPGANLTDANLTGAILSYANLSYANLPGAILSYANLSYANLSGANLSYANLSGVDLSRANLICGGKRSDGHDFYLIRELSGAVMVRAGCRYFTPDAARGHWTATRADTRLGYESLAIVDHLMRMAEIAGWISEGG